MRSPVPGCAYYPSSVMSAPWPGFTRYR
jgi:hypothetical protein